MKKIACSRPGPGRRGVGVGLSDAATTDRHPCRRRDRRRDWRADRLGGFRRQRGRRHCRRHHRRGHRRSGRQCGDGATRALRTVGLRLQRQPDLRRFLLNSKGGNMKKTFALTLAFVAALSVSGCYTPATTDGHAGGRRNRRWRRRADRFGAHRGQRRRRHCRRHYRRRDRRADRQRRDRATQALRAVGLRLQRQPLLPRLVLIDRASRAMGFACAMARPICDRRAAPPAGI